MRVFMPNIMTVEDSSSLGDGAKTMELSLDDAWELARRQARQAGRAGTIPPKYRPTMEAYFRDPDDDGSPADR